MWYAHRRQDGTVGSIHQNPQPGYAEEVLQDDDPVVVAMLNPPIPARVQRAEEYRKAVGNNEEILVDLIETVTAQLEALTQPMQRTPEFIELLGRVQAAKTKVPNGGR